MNRATVIQKVIDQVSAKTYLEIGVSTGQVLFNIKAPKRIGVDPAFNFSFTKKVKLPFVQPKIHTYEITSDDFFAKHAEQVLKDGIDVAFVDGLHTYKQTLVDVENCLKYLNDGGVIIMHDCNPISAATAYPVKNSINEVLALAAKGEVPGWNGCWNGDTWKALVHLRIAHDDLSIFTLDIDWGLGVVIKGKSNKLNDLTLEELDKADYSLLEKDRNHLLNLQPPSYLASFLKSLKS